MKKVLITGYNGLIGHSLVKILIKNGQYEVIGIGRSSSEIIQTIRIDLSNEWDAGKLPEKVDAVIHLAQSELFRDFPNSAQNVFNVNAASTLKLLEYTRKARVEKFIYASSGGIYGNSNSEFTEDAPVSIRSDIGFYLSTKFCSELLVQNYIPFFNADILRFFFVYGQRQKGHMLIPRLIQSVKSDTPIHLQGNDGLMINPIYVEDAASAVVACLNLKGSNRINVGGSEVLTLREICKIIGKQLTKEPVFNIENVRPQNLIADISKMQDMLIVPKTSFFEGIKKIICV